MKKILLIIDGMEDEPIPALGNHVPREAAHMPALDFMRLRGQVDKVSTIPAGCIPSTDVALLGLLECKFPQSISSRSWLEALGMGIDVGDSDLCLRCNLISHDGGILTSHCGEGVSNDDAREIVDLLNNRLGSERLRFYHGTGYRNLLVVKECHAQVSARAPHELLGRPVGELRVASSDSGLAAVLNRCIDDAMRLLHGRHSNGVALWSPGRRLSLDRHIGGAVVAGVDLVKGIGRAVGMDVVNVVGATGNVDTDCAAKCRAALAALADHDMVLIHVEGPDEASHRLDFMEKVAMLERIDRDIITPLLKSGMDIELTVQADHGTSSLTGRHLDCMVERVTYISGS